MGAKQTSFLFLIVAKKKAKILGHLDKDGVHPLAFETVYLDVLHPYTKGWKTYTLSYYDILIQQMVRLYTMECPKEDRICCELFFRFVNKMLQEYICDKEGWETNEYVFNPYHIVDYEHGGIKQLGMKAVLGETFFNERTSSCNFTWNKLWKTTKSMLSKK